MAASCFIVACASSPPDGKTAGLTMPRYQYIIDVSPRIALHRAFNDDRYTYLEFLDARRMNPVVTRVDGTPLSCFWSDQLLTVEGVHDNLTVTTPHGVAHVYARMPAPAAYVAAPTPARALEYGAEVPPVRQVTDNFGYSAELPVGGDAMLPDRISIPFTGNFSEALGDGQASKLLLATREATRITISAMVPKGTERKAYSRIAEARQFLIDNGIAADRIKTAKAVANSTNANQVNFLILY